MSLIRPKSLRDLALEHIRDQIIDGVLEMGQPLSERGISEELGISKSPVREALAQLREEGLVGIEPQKGAKVFTLTTKEVDQLCDFREFMEGAAFDLAIVRSQETFAAEMDYVVSEMANAQEKNDTRRYLRLDSEFHLLIFKHCGNCYLSASYKRYAGKIATVRQHLSRLPEHTSSSFKEHKEILDAVRSKDLLKIRKILSAHIDRTRRFYAESLSILPYVEN